jgi:uncharacterized damage-inducible protein DinB
LTSQIIDLSLAMQLIDTAIKILGQLQEFVLQVHENDFSKPSEVLSGASIGQHLRHTLEFFICLEKGTSAGVINYDKRVHDKLIESDKFIALDAIQSITNFISSQVADKPLKLEVSYGASNDDCVTIETNFWRELSYNIEHAVHHMAIMKIGIKQVANYILLPPDFGVAVSTIRYKESAKAVAE